MSRLFVKICGITRLQDAELASGLGAGALGFVFWRDSPRYIAPEAARAIAQQIPAHAQKVGVFVDEDLDQVRHIMDFVGLDFAQLHGHETAEYCRELMGPDAPRPQGRRRVIKAVAMRDNGAVDVPDVEPGVVLLVDAHDAVRHGGTGRTVNWDAARELAVTRPTILAGGLNAANVRLAIRSVRPYGVDVSSGVESAPGMKDPARLRSFFEALHD
jgi:phosphoribosylanthranilate isomerase